MKNVLVFVVVALSALTPLAARTVERVQVEANEPRFVMSMADGEQAPVAPDLQTIPEPREKPTVSDADKTSIVFGSTMLDAMVGLFLSFGGSVVGWMAWWKHKLFKTELDSQQRDALHDGIKRGILYAAELIRKRVGAGIKVDVGSELIATVGQYMIDNSAKVLKHFNLDGRSKDDMGDLVTANAAQMGISLDTGKFVGTGA